MTTLMRELPPDRYGTLEKAAAQEAKKPAEWARALLEERLAALPAEEGERARLPRPARGRPACRTEPRPVEIDQA